ncbi:hypothetical protein LguiA_012161 [Lonicera macranthoides]
MLCAVSLSIDCGSSDVSTDENSIIWIGDNDLIQNGETHVVQSTNSLSHVMDTLRVFTTHKKNCYSWEANKGVQVLVRASFYYGNYDKKSSPPTFDLQFDGNHWDSVVTSMDQMVYYENIYVLQMDSISICIAQTKEGQFPFISALEIRSLESNMYNHVNAEYALFLKSRTAYGADAVIRYSDDIYDRIWIPVVAGNGLIKATSDAIFIDNNAVPDRPPQAVLQNAITASVASSSITLNLNFVDSDKLVYINFYFSEVTQLDSTELRSFRILVNNQPSKPIVPIYANVTELNASNFTLSSNTTFSLVPTPDSTLPPLINAMEIFYISDVMTKGTDSNDVEGLSTLLNSFDVLNQWSGDPCLPVSFTWDWLDCSTDATPRVTAMYLNSSGLSGLLPDFSSMDAVEKIDLHNNSITGPIPDFLGTLPNLKELNLADNQFTGPIPASLLKNTKLKLVVSGNSNLCTPGRGSCETANTPVSPGSNPFSGGYKKKKKSKLPVILGSTIPTFFVFWAILGTLAILRHKKKTAAVAAANAGKQGGANRPNGNLQGMANKICEGVLNEFKVNVEEQNNNNVEMPEQEAPIYNGENSARHA